MSFDEPRDAHRVQVLGSAASNATVSLRADGGLYAPTSRKGDYFRGELPVDNSSTAVWLTVTNLAVLQQGASPDIAVTNAGHQFLPRTPETIGHDADGNLTNNGRWSISWDAANRAASFISLSSAPGGSKRKVECAYDHAWRRMQKIVSTNSGAAYFAQYTNRFVYDGWNLMAMLDGNNNLLQSYT